jgi:hypothetical protein
MAWGPGLDVGSRRIWLRGGIIQILDTAQRLLDRFNGIDQRPEQFAQTLSKECPPIDLVV